MTLLSVVASLPVVISLSVVISGVVISELSVVSDNTVLFVGAGTEAFEAVAVKFGIIGL